MVSLSTAATLLAGAGLLAYIVSTLRTLLDKRKLPPMLSGAWPLVGNFLEFSKNPVSIIQRGVAELGDIFTVRLFGEKITIVVGEASHPTFFKGGDAELSQNEVYSFMTPIFGPGIVYDAPASRRVQQLKFMSGGLRTARLRSYVPKIEAECEAFFGAWPDEGELCFKTAMSELIILTASRCLMGNEVRENLFRQVADLYVQLDEGITPLSFIFPRAPIPAHARRDKARAEMVRLFSGVIRARRDAGRSEQDKNEDILQAFMDARYKDGGQLSESEITGMLIALLFAGQHTSSITSSWTLLMLLANPKYLDAVLDEQRAILKEHGDSLDYAAVADMTMLGLSMKEAIRLNPPIVLLLRKVKKARTYRGYTIPAGHSLGVCPPVSMKQEPYTEADQFQPDRYLPPRSEGSKPLGYVGFGGGNHGCMGEQFAYIQVKTILSVLLRNFDVQLKHGRLPKPDYTAMVVPPSTKDEGCYITFRRRKLE
eukprot:PLAT6794.1.p2 GENE.PLAT6794.1~~PLAT6794.1.p2  ORF type:complete len:498 (+),score=258.47 PLAT6794.1:48-1496(+)